MSLLERWVETAGYSNSYVSPGRVEMVLLDEGKDTGVGAKGELFDISVDGLLFSLRISQKNKIRLLFGRNVVLTMESTVASRFSISGVVLAVCSQPIIGNEYSVSIQFSRALAQKEEESYRRCT